MRSEHTAQAQFVALARVRHPDVVIAAVPNGGLRDKRTAKRLKAEGVLPGFPDLIVAEPRSPYHGLFVEMKREDGRVSPAQAELAEKLEARGYRVVTAYGRDEALEALERYLALPRWVPRQTVDRITLSARAAELLR